MRDFLFYLRRCIYHARQEWKLYRGAGYRLKGWKTVHGRRVLNPEFQVRVDEEAAAAVRDSLNDGLCPFCYRDVSRLRPGQVHFCPPTNQN